MESPIVKSSRVSKFNPAESADKILVRGIHLEITPALRAAALEKGARLLRHQARLVRVRLDLEFDQTKGDHGQFIAKGRVEIRGPDLIASVATENAGKSLDLLIDKLDRMIRERTRNRADRRNDRPEGTEFRDQLAPENEAPEANPAGRANAPTTRADVASGVTRKKPSL
jgi:putative sigma-54 modulation protein